uniref:Uncharacterized protein n=1 Tax=Heterorhabditis bacteriophora TaxID=37862 RepID=A0A1I7X1Q0_HETBA
MSTDQPRVELCPPVKAECSPVVLPSISLGQSFASLQATSTSSDSLFSTSVTSLPSVLSQQRSDLDLSTLKTEPVDGDDDFFDLSKHHKGRSASFGGTTQYSSQFAAVRSSLFAPALDPIRGSVSSRMRMGLFFSSVTKWMAVAANQCDKKLMINVIA